MGEFRKALETEESFEFEGRTYRLAALTFEAIAAWESWLAERATRKLYQARAWMSAADFDQERAILQREKTAGAYDFFGAASVEAQGKGWEGRIELLAIRLALAQEGQLDLPAARKLARQINEREAELWREIQEKLDEMDADAPDPNARSRTETPAPSGATASNPSAPSSPASPGT